MMKSVYCTVALLMNVMLATAQNEPLPVKEWTSNVQGPLVLYISGDGGLNSFSTALCSKINKSGYSVSALNSRSYFWKKKTPGQAANDVAAYLDMLLKDRINKQWLLVGYSFGADVVPFIINNLPEHLRKKLVKVVLLAPSTTTDFEIRIADMLSGKQKRNLDVVREINRMVVPKTMTVFGSDDKSFPINRITLENYSNHFLPGGHHFDGNVDEVAGILIKFFQ